MLSVNNVMLAGNLTHDPELRALGGGRQACRFGMAVNRQYRTSDGEDVEETCFVDVDAFGRTAESVAQYMHRGSSVLVEGRLQQDRWQDRVTGKNRSRLFVVAHRVHFLGNPSSRYGSNDTRDAQPPPFPTTPDDRE